MTVPRSPSASPPGAAPRRDPMPRVLLAAALALIAFAGLGFWPSYLSRLGKAMDAYTHTHAVLGTLWLLLLASQALLADRRAMALHRRLGRLSYALAPAFVVSGILLAHHRFSRMDAQTFAREGFSLYLPLVMALLFALAYALAIAHRRDARLHSRFMASTALPLVDPVFVRIIGHYLPELPRPWLYQAITFGFTAFLAFLLLRSLPASAPGRRAYGGYFAAMSAGLAGWFVVAQTLPWLRFAEWFRGLPLT